MVNSLAPNTEPCGTPDVTGHFRKRESPTVVRHFGIRTFWPRTFGPKMFWPVFFYVGHFGQEVFFIGHLFS